MEASGVRKYISAESCQKLETVLRRAGNGLHTDRNTVGDMLARIKKQARLYHRLACMSARNEREREFRVRVP